MWSEAGKVQENKSAIEAAIETAKLKKQKSEEDLHKKVHKKGHKRAKSEAAKSNYKIITPTTSPEKKFHENNIPDSVLFSMPFLPFIPKKLKDEVDKIQLGSTGKKYALKKYDQLVQKCF